MIAVIAVLCSLTQPSDCREQTITNSDVAEITMSSCMVGAPQIVEWLKQNHPGKRLAGWKCTIGRKGENI